MYNQDKIMSGISNCDLIEHAAPLTVVNKSLYFLI